MKSRIVRASIYAMLAVLTVALVSALLTAVVVWVPYGTVFLIVVPAFGAAFALAYSELD